MELHAIGLHEAQTIFRARMPAFTNALREAVAIWTRSLHPHPLVTLNAVTGSQLINDAWYQLAEHGLVDDAGVRLLNNASTNHKCLLIDGRLVVRFKHADSTYRTRNFPTPRALAWNAQKRFETIPDVVRVDFSYRVDLTGTLIQDALIQYSRTHEPIWRWQVWGPPITEFAAARRDMMGRHTFAYENYQR